MSAGSTYRAGAFRPAFVPHLGGISPTDTSSSSKGGYPMSEGSVPLRPPAATPTFSETSAFFKSGSLETSIGVSNAGYSC